MNYLNIYYCEECDEEWEDTHDCSCNDKCPGCGKEYTPVTSVDLNQDTLVIHGVDLSLLNQQRRLITILYHNLYDMRKTLKINEEQLEALGGVVNMLDSWYDNQVS